MLGSAPHDGVTVVNVFTVEPVNQAEAGALLAAVNERIAGGAGFMGAVAHRSLDGTRIANVARWSSEGQIRTALAQPDLRPMLAKLATIARGDWHLYDVIGVTEPPTA